MMNYMRSEVYKLLKTKGIYITYAICISLLVLAALTLYYSGHSGGYFPYYRADFYYNNVFGVWLFIALIGSIINTFLTNKESKRVLKQSISYGITRTTIYFSKYFVSLIAFMILCIISIIVMVTCAYLLFPKDMRATDEFLLSLINFAPIILGIFSLMHALNITLQKESLSTIISVFILFGISTFAYILMNINQSFETFYKLTPKVLSDRVLSEYMNHQVELSIDFWISSFIITGLSIWFGYIKFKRQDF